MDRLSKRLIELQSDGASATGTNKPILSFDKDDEDTLDFVTAAANLRSTAFHIEQKTKFDIKRELILANMLYSTPVAVLLT
jgi:ubiquitin-like 1-activating enzyme E1 B